MNKSEQPLRYRVTVPLQDADVINWMAAQSSPSFSIRLLIRAIIAKYGITDVTCLPVSASLDLDMSNPELSQETSRPVLKTNKTSVSLTDIRQGAVVLPSQQIPARAVNPEQGSSYQAQTPAPVQAPVQPAQPAQPVRPSPPPPASNSGGYVPKEISDLM